MSSYVKATNFATKDTLPTGDSNKIVKGTEIDNEFTAIAGAISSKSDIASPAFTGTPSAPTATSGSNTTQLATTAFVTAAVTDTVTASATFTNKTISLASNTITGTTAQFNAALSDNDFATIAGSETLTNKTLTSPTMTGTPVAPTATTGTNTTQLATTAFVVDAISNIGVAVPSGTLMLFQQTSAPTGWTKQTTHNNKALRVVSGTAGSGGTTAFTSVFTNQTVSTSISVSGTSGATTLSTTQIPSHTHSVTQSGSQTGSLYSEPGYASTPSSSTTGGTGGGGSHTHSFSWSGSPTSSAVVLDVQYVDLIIASKN